MNNITLTTETETKLIFTFTVDYNYMLTTPFGLDDPSEILDTFDNDTTTPLTYTFTVFNNPNEYYFATRLAENGYGSDCADYEHIDDIAFTFGQPIADVITAELNRRNWPLESSAN